MALEWRLDIHTKEQVDSQTGLPKKIGELVDYESINLTEMRNDYAGAIVSHLGNNQPAEIQSLLQKEGTELWVYRKGGRMNDSLELIARLESEEVGITENSDGKQAYSIVFQPIQKQYLLSREITKVYTAQQEEDIAWDLINTTQTDTKSGAYTLSQVDFGIAQKELEATGNTRTEEFEQKILLHALQYLADLEDDGATQYLRGFRLSPHIQDPSMLEFSWYQNYGVDSGVIMTSDQIVDMRVVRKNQKYVNRMTVTNGVNSAVAISADTSKIDQFKMRERTIGDRSLVTSSQVAAEAAQLLSLHQNATTLYTVKSQKNNPFIGEFRTGDFITIQYKNEFISVNQQFQVYRMDLTYNPDGTEDVNLLVSATRPRSLMVDPSEVVVQMLNDQDNAILNLQKQ